MGVVDKATSLGLSGNSSCIMSPGGITELQLVRVDVEISLLDHQYTGDL